MQGSGIAILFKGINFQRLLGGLWVTLRIALISIGLSCVLGLLFGLLMLILSSSWVLVFTEEGIATYKDALWYCFALVTTIGFGDITAVTDLGRTMSVVLGVYGIIVVALITSIIVNFYGEIKKTRTGEEAGAENTNPE